MSGDAAPVEGAPADGDMELYDLCVVVDRVEGRPVCGLGPGDRFTVTGSNELRIPEGRHFCMYALGAVLPLLAAKQRRLPAGDWLERDSEVACPDPDERLIMRIERTGTARLRSADLT
ncbi:TIGR04076 family protein [Microbacterium sp. 1P10UB]|uniref:TIGR04076 family protein n=1 Tax=unclassified Microbacterium TaxID=2609290 RepID=UPI00399F2949